MEENKVLLLKGHRVHLRLIQSTKESDCGTIPPDGVRHTEEQGQHGPSHLSPQQAVPLCQFARLSIPPPFSPNSFLSVTQSGEPSSPQEVLFFLTG